MILPLMPKATAIWLIENTSLNFDQIGEFCGMHALEVQSLADAEIQVMLGVDPLATGQLTQEEITRCEKDPKAVLRIAETSRQYVSTKTKGAKYTPVSRRQDKPDAVAWLIKNYGTMTDAQISKLIGTTKSTIKSVREKTHWNSANIKPRDPVFIGLCSQTAMDAVVAKLKPSEGSAA